MSQYGGLGAALKVYWEDYGGWSDFRRSPLLHLSLLVATLGSAKLILIDWRALTVGMMPTILGFSLAAYAITFSLMGTKLHLALTRASDTAGKPLARTVNATLFHNVFVQCACLSFAVITNGTLIAQLIGLVFGDVATARKLSSFQSQVASWLGTFLLVYAILLLFSAALAMFRLGRLVPSGVSNLPANDPAQTLPPSSPPAAEVIYGWRWTIVRAVAKVLRVKG